MFGVLFPAGKNVAVKKQVREIVGQKKKLFRPGDGCEYTEKTVYGTGAKAVKARRRDGTLGTSHLYIYIYLRTHGGSQK